MPNSHLVLHKKKHENNTLKNKISIKHLSKIINLGAKNCPVGRKVSICPSVELSCLDNVVHPLEDGGHNEAAEAAEGHRHGEQHLDQQ